MIGESEDRNYEPKCSTDKELQISARLERGQPLLSPLLQFILENEELLAVASRAGLASVIFIQLPMNIERLRLARDGTDDAAASIL